MDEIFYNKILLFIKIVIIFINIILLAEYFFKNRIYKNFEKYLILFFSLMYMVVFAIRPIIPYSDTAVYLYKYENLKTFHDVLEGGKDILFFIYSYFTKLIFENKTGYLFFIAFAYLTPLLIALIRFKHSFLIFSLFTLTFSFENLGINIIRQGIGLSFFTLALILFFKNKKSSFIYFFVAVLFHISLLIPVALFFILIKIKNLYTASIILMCCSILSVLNINIISFIENIPIISAIFEERNQNYSEVVANYKVGFRPDFFLYNYIFILLGYFIYFKFKFIKLEDKRNYLIILNLFIILSSLFFLMFTQSFSDRYGVLSWQLIPLLFLPFILQYKSKIGFINIFTIFLFYATISFIFMLK